MPSSVLHDSRPKSRGEKPRSATSSLGEKYASGNAQSGANATRSARANATRSARLESSPAMLRVPQPSQSARSGQRPPGYVTTRSQSTSPASSPPSLLRAEPISRRSSEPATHSSASSTQQVRIAADATPIVPRHRSVSRVRVSSQRAAVATVANRSAAALPTAEAAPFARSSRPTERDAVRALLPLLDELRPKKRADCIDGPRPCPWCACPHHNLLEISTAKPRANGTRPTSIRLNRAQPGNNPLGRRPGLRSNADAQAVETFIDDAVEILSTMVRSCSLDVTRDHPDGLLSPDLGRVLGVTKQQAHDEVRDVTAKLLRSGDAAVKQLEELDGHDVDYRFNVTAWRAR